MSLVDLMMKTFAPSGIGGAFNGQTPPPLQNGFEDYGPWGAGGGNPGPGAFPAAPPQASSDMIAKAVAMAQQGGQPGFTPQQMQTQEQAPAPQTAPTHAAALPGYSAMMDPNGGPFGKIGRLMGSPTRAEAQAARNGEQLSAGIQEVKKRVEQGLSPQKAIMDYLGTPGGQQWLMSPGADPVAELHNYVQATKGPAADVRESNGNIIAEKTPGAGDYQEVYHAPISEKDRVQTEKDRAEMKIAADRYKLDVQKYNEEKQQTGITNRQKEDQLRTDAEKLKVDQQRLGMDLKIGDQQILKSQSDIEQADKTPMQNDFDRDVKEWDTAHPGQPYPATFDEYKQKYTKLQTPGGTQLSPKMDEEAIVQSGKSDQALAKIQVLDNFEAMSKGVTTGWAQAIALPFQNALVSLGMSEEEATKEVAKMQTLESLSNEMALAKRGFNEISGAVGLTGNTSDKDLNFLVKSVPNIWNTTMANKGILILARVAARRQALLSSAKANFIYDNGNLKDWDKERDRLIDATPLLTKTEEAQLLSMNSEAGQIGAEPSANPQNAQPTAAKAAPPADYEPDDPNRMRSWELLDPKYKAMYKPSTGNVRNNEQLQLKGQTPGGPVQKPTAAPAQVPAPTPIPGPAPMQNEMPQGTGGGLTDMMMKFMMGGDGQAPAPTMGPAPSPMMGLGGQSGQDTSFQQPATADNFITLQDILKMFSGGR